MPKTSELHSSITMQDFLGRYGLNTASDIKNFLLSPAGKTVLTLHSDRIAQEGLTATERAREHLEEQLLSMRIRAALFLRHTRRKDKANVQLKELLLDYIAKTRQYLDKKEEKIKNGQQQKQLPNEAMQELIAAYTEATNQAQVLYNDEIILLDAIQLLHDEKQQLLAKYALYEEHVDDERFEAFIDDAGVVNTEAVNEAKIHLTKAMDALYENINECIERDEDPTELVQEQNALNLQMGILLDLLDIDIKQKFFVALDGSIETSFKKAQFILQKDWQLFYKDGKHYLLKPGQDWSSVQETAEALASAERLFHRAKNDIMTVRMAIKFNRGAEEHLHQERLASKNTQLTQVREAQADVANQLIQIHAARANMISSTRSGSSSITTIMAALKLTPKPSITPQTITHKASPRPTLKPAATQSYEEQLKRLLLLNKATPGQLFALAKTAPTNERQRVQAYLNAQFQGRAQLTPISGEVLRRVINTMGSFQGNRQSPQTNPIASPGYQNPTPFNTRPNPLDPNK